MRRNPRKLPLDALIPRIQEINGYIREGMKYGLGREDGLHYRPVTVNRAKQTVTFHYFRGPPGWDWGGGKDSWQFPAKTKSDLSEIRQYLTEIKRNLTLWLRRSHSPKRWRDRSKDVPVYTKRDKRTGRFTENPRKISVEAAEALMQGREYKKSNTEVVQIGDTDFLLVLHGNQIAEYDTSDGSLYVSDGGYTPMSPTTKDRLNALPGVEVHTSQKQLYLNGQRWSGKWEQMSGPKEPQWDHADQDHLEWH